MRDQMKVDIYLKITVFPNQRAELQVLASTCIKEKKIIFLIQVAIILRHAKL